MEIVIYLCTQHKFLCMYLYTVCLYLRTFIKLSSNVNMIFPKGKEDDFLKNSIICVLSKAVLTWNSNSK